MKGFPPGSVNWYNLFVEQLGDPSQKPQESLPPRNPTSRNNPYVIRKEVISKYTQETTIYAEEKS